MHLTVTTVYLTGVLTSLLGRLWDIFDSGAIMSLRSTKAPAQHQSSISTKCEFVQQELELWLMPRLSHARNLEFRAFLGIWMIGTRTTNGDGIAMNQGVSHDKQAAE